MKKALIIIDYVNDFIDTNGSLSCGAAGQSLDLVIASQIKTFKDQQDFIVVASDAHNPNDVYNPEHDFFPPHCLIGTKGADLYGKTSEAISTVPTNQLIILPKLRYSAFAGTPLDLKLRERSIKEIFLVGVCTDICVLHTAIDAYNLGYKINIISGGVGSFNSPGHDFSLLHFKNVLGANII